MGKPTPPLNYFKDKVCFMYTYFEVKISANAFIVAIVRIFNEDSRNIIPASTTRLKVDSGSWSITKHTNPKKRQSIEKEFSSTMVV